MDKQARPKLESDCERALKRHFLRLPKMALSLSGLEDKEDILRQANKCTSMIDRSVDYATIIST